MLFNSFIQNSKRLGSYSYLRRTNYTCALENRFKKIDQRFIKLSDNPSQFNLLSLYSPFIFQTSNAPFKKFACKPTATVLVLENIFGQSRYQKIDTVKKLLRALKDNEEGTFFLNIHGSNFINQKNEESVFEGHAFTLSKVIEKGQIGYLLAQSYVEKYSLKNFLSNTENRYFFDFFKLKEKILRPYLSILFKKGPWTKKECQAFSAITTIYSERLIGFYPNNKICPSGRLLETADFGRTTNKESGYEMRIDYLSFLVVQRNRNSGNPDWKFDNVFSIQPPISQVLYQRFEAVDNEIKKLFSIDGMMAHLAKTYYKTVYNKNIEIVEKDPTCQDIACAIFQANLFNHSSRQQLTLRELKIALADFEEGTFMINIYADNFINSDNQAKLFPGHSFIIIKVIEDQEIGYRFVHTFVGQLNLIDFLESKRNRYDDFGSLEKYILDPTCSLLEKKGPWSDEESQNFFLISSFYSSNLEGYSPPSGKLAYNIIRTTNNK